MKLKAPLYVFLEATSSCNLRCTHCYVSRKTHNELSTEEVFNFIDYLVREEVAILVLTGGEPFCRKEILEIVTYSIDCGLWTSIFTNGTMRRPLLDKVSKMDVYNIQTTLFSHNPALHDRVVQTPGAFKKTTAFIKELVDAGHSVTTNTPVLKENVSHIPALFELASDLGVGRFGIFPALPFGRGRDIVDTSKLNQLYVEAGTLLYHKKEDIPDERIQIDGVIGRAVAMLGGPPRNIADIFNASSCAAGRSFVSVTSDGYVVPCSIFSSCVEARLGNIRETPLLDIWCNSCLLKKLRRNEHNNEACSGCEKREDCPKCIAEAYSVYSTFDAPDPRCPRSELYKKERTAAHQRN